MLYYVFNGTFCGMMNALYEAFSKRQNPECFITYDSSREDLFGDYVSLNSDESKSEALIKKIRERMGEIPLSNIIYCFLSDVPNSAGLIFNYVKLGFTAGKDIDSHLASPMVKPLHDIVHKVRHEKHRMLGLVRFAHVEKDLYYSAVSPDHNIVSLIAPHFSRRLADQNWIIHDIKRNIAVHYDKKKWKMVDFSIERKPEETTDELFYQGLWKSYFKSIAIAERKNPKLQRHFVPRRYWKNLVEFS